MASRQSWSKAEEEEVFFDAESDLPMEVDVQSRADDDAESSLPLEVEGGHPPALLTQDDWVHVLGHVDIPRDGWNLAHAHPLFWRIFHSELSDLWTSGMFLAIVPYLLKHLPFEDVLGLRLVNRFSRSAGDHYLEHSGVISQENVQIRVCLDHPNRIYVRGAQGNTTMPKLASWMNLKLVCTGIIQSRSMDAEFLSFFSRHGHQVENLSVSRLYYQNVHPVDFMTFLRNLLIYLPNVKVIVLDLDRIFNGNWESDHQRLAELETQFLEENPLPALPSLKTMLLENRSVTRVLAPQAILQAYGGHLQELELRLPVNLPTSMSSLKDLTLELQNPEMLSSIQASGAPLESLILEIEDKSGTKPIELLWALQPFKNTLDNLHVESWTWEFGEIGELSNMEWPKLKTLSLSDCTNCTPTNIGFVFSFPNLEELELWIHLPDSDDQLIEPEERQRIVTEYTSRFEVEKLQEPNLWTRLGSLKFIKIVDFSEGDEYLIKRPSEL